MVSMRETGPHKDAYAQIIVNAMDFTHNVEHFALCYKKYNPRINRRIFIWLPAARVSI
jgi:hypothetical protein